MNEKLKKKWVAALRSGDYQQGTGSLKKRETVWSEEKQHFVYVSDSEKYCCLGVLCELLPKGRGEFDPKGNYFTFHPTAQQKRGSETNSGELEEAALNYVGLTFEQQEKLIYFNDDKKWSFKQIAAYVERYL